MRIEKTITDDGVLAEVGARLQRARLERNQTQQQLADEAGIGVRTLERLEFTRDYFGSPAYACCAPSTCSTRSTGRCPRPWRAPWSA